MLQSQCLIYQTFPAKSYTLTDKPVPTKWSCDKTRIFKEESISLMWGVRQCRQAWVQRRILV